MRAVKLSALEGAREEKSRAQEATFCKPLSFLGSFFILEGEWMANESQGHS